MTSIYDLSVKKQDGTDLPLSDFKGKVLLIVNTATGCGFTPQYKDLEKLYSEFHDKGLEIIDIPCNQFKEQAPGTDAEITQFCQLQYHTEFPQMKKSHVNGADEMALYKYLKEVQPFKGFPDSPEGKEMKEWYSEINPQYMDDSDIKWNFTKFVVNRSGDVVARFEPCVPVSEIEPLIASLVAEK